ncbi:PTS sugar transporter subunit IIC [Clostridium gasigenes]|uniref:PTS sugar transporter subunit IIC n=1 Tax=Clostridium gasigenes TaxID=94869 RepID=UPI001C0E88D2|nr:PTS sugar transporter subunit IIC [Clostridium gasigenes]MBU3132757.1 PTS sugar transporter subunit IIC [Clostridium gasigenes]
MQKFMDFMEKYFIPVAAKIGAQKHLIAVRDGFVSIMPIVMAGSFATLINALPVPGYKEFMEKTFGIEWKFVQNAIWDASFGVMSLLVVFTTAYSLAKSYEKDGIACATVCYASLAMFYGVVPVGGDSFKGATGLFVALGIALIFGTIFCKLLGNPKLLIKMPDGVPPAVSKSFAALFPSMIVLVLAGITKAILVWVFGINSIHQLVLDSIQGPLMGVFTAGLAPILFLIFLQQLLWFFGLHGSNVLAPVINAILLPLTTLNIEAFNLGNKPENIINSQFLDSFVNMGGSGATICLLIAIFIVSKNKANKIIANLSVAPGLFNINEPVIFGMPIVLNPIYIIPFIIVPLVCAIIAYLATLWGIMPVIGILAPWTTPPVIGAWMSTGSFRGALVALINIAVGTALYLPFVMAADKKAILEESQGLAQ